MDLTSISAALTFNKGESARYAKYNDQCLAELEEVAEYESDELLVQLVRIQHLTQKIFEVNNRDQLVDELPNIPNTPMSVYHTAFELELSRLRSSIPVNLKNNCKRTSYISLPSLLNISRRYHNQPLQHNSTPTLRALTQRCKLTRYRIPNLHDPITLRPFNGREVLPTTLRPEDLV